MASPATAGDSAQYLGFDVAEEQYAIAILRVREILEYDTLTKVPTAPSGVRGVINVRGRVVPVVDLAVRLGLPETVVGKESCIVVVEIELGGEPAVVGLLVDRVRHVLEWTAGDIQPPPAFGTHAGVDCLQGMGRVGKKFVLLLDVDTLLAATPMPSVLRS
jgi:purine-binding chemotaxis protein CheW